MENSKDFKKYYDRYQRNGCTIEQLRRLTELGALQDWEFKLITGQDYVAVSQ